LSKIFDEESDFTVCLVGYLDILVRSKETQKALGRRIGQDDFRPAVCSRIHPEIEKWKKRPFHKEEGADREEAGSQGPQDQGKQEEILVAD
jgi:hypothetical protein